MDSWTASLESLTSSRRIDAEYFDPRVQATLAAVTAHGSTRLGDLSVSVARGVTPEYADGGSVRVVKTAHVRRFEVLSSPAQYVTTEFAAQNERALVTPCSVLITSTGVGSVGRCLAVLEVDEPLLADNHVTVVKLNDAQTACYVAAYLQSEAGIQLLVRATRGSSRQIELYPEDVRALEIPQLSEPEMQKVAESWRNAALAVVGARFGVRQAEDRMLGDVHNDTSALGVAKPWSVDIGALKRARRIDPQFVEPSLIGLRKQLQDRSGRSLRSICTGVRRGVQPESYSADGAVTIVKSKDVVYPGLNLEGCERSDAVDTTDARLAGGELLLNMTGEGSLGRAGVVPEVADDEVIVCSVDVQVLEIDRRYAVPEYIALFLNSTIGRALTVSLQTGSSGQQHLYPAHFDLITVPLGKNIDEKPDLDFQREIVALAEARDRAVRDARATGLELDSIIRSALGVSVDLRTVPR